MTAPPTHKGEKLPPDDYDQEEASGITAAVMEYLEPEVEQLLLSNPYHPGP